MKYTAIVNGKTYEVEIARAAGGARSIGSADTAAARPAPRPVESAPAASQAAVNTAPAPAVSSPAGSASVVSPMPGKILDILVNVGDAVKDGQTVIIMEAMKMEIEVRAERAGTVSSIAVKKGEAVDGSAVLLTL